MPLDTFSLFLFDTDTLKRYPLDEIKTEYKILQRYDLSSGDIEKFLDKYERVIIPYPLHGGDERHEDVSGIWV
ncbi:MAG: hypothetical protein LBL79_04950 [Prevotella sp.]|nr:hypothetical protein [Prevotella sp.]